MEIILHIQAKKLDRQFNSAVNEYVKRLSPFAAVKINTHKDIQNIPLQSGSYIINVNPSHPLISSTYMAEKINDICVSGYSRIELIVSSSYSYAKSNFDFSISYMDMDSQLVLVALTEQLYRAFTILNNITYHK
ncbi:MAG: 23S rRNA (pseudouridine(1915)-N(3))-methyltransferase RlmH [Clostridium sp.]|nr:23S rRNA (pseudouridine(1915)-N(3))-methyltransferase RlmH [Clostridium sp.]